MKISLRTKAKAVTYAWAQFMVDPEHGLPKVGDAIRQMAAFMDAEDREANNKQPRLFK